MTSEPEKVHPLVVVASEDGYVDAGDWTPDGDVEVHARDEAQIQPLINRQTVGATDMRMGLGRMLPGMYHIRHHHPYGSEFYYFTKGSCIVHLDGDDIRAARGTAIYIPPDCVHSVLNDTDKAAEFVVGCSKSEYAALGLVYDE